MRYLSPSVYLAPNNFVLVVFNPKTLVLPQLLASEKFIVELKAVKHPTTIVARTALGKGILPGPETVCLRALQASYIYLLSLSEALPNHAMFKKLKSWQLYKFLLILALEIPRMPLADMVAHSHILL